ncbi:unnamed protein product [Pseudo-nitzschia multistriata]|uniref:Uncharacterized protein n=1 Tax=Pseudo-nitzschia multistriata TaxID=183589 RepID=A0A448ZAA4_9STRA|nr:unnamed protein product [Pseudo-nitzschia multistriata]
MEDFPKIDRANDDDDCGGDGERASLALASPLFGPRKASAEEGLLSLWTGPERSLSPGSSHPWTDRTRALRVMTHAGRILWKAAGLGGAKGVAGPVSMVLLAGLLKRSVGRGLLGIQGAARNGSRALAGSNQTETEIETDDDEIDEMYSEDTGETIHNNDSIVDTIVESIVDGDGNAPPEPVRGKRRKPALLSFLLPRASVDHDENENDDHHREVVEEWDFGGADTEAGASMDSRPPKRTRRETGWRVWEEDPFSSRHGVFSRERPKTVRDRKDRGAETLRPRKRARAAGHGWDHQNSGCNDTFGCSANANAHGYDQGQRRFLWSATA